MIDNEKLILMYKDFEVLSFEVDYVNHNIKFLGKLEHFDKAPNDIKDDEFVDRKLTSFFTARLIPQQRSDYQKIIEATNCRNNLELSFRGHGLSLSNHYWYKRSGENLKYDDINFFSNKWDDSFARAVIAKDYEALKTCDLNVPDIVTPGWGVKGWIYDNGPKLYKLGIDEGHNEEVISEVLASRLASRFFDDNHSFIHELKEINGRYASVTPSILTIDEEMFPMANVIPHDLYGLYLNKNCDKRKGQEFYRRIEEIAVPGIKEFFVKVACFRSLAFVSDLHFHNISIIRNLKTGQIRVAPLYDLGGAFGSTRTGKSIITNANEGTLLIVYYLFNELEPEWDYSWYDPKKLEGFEDEIKEYLSKSDFYSPEIIDCVIKIYHQQKKSLEEMVNIKK